MLSLRFYHFLTQKSLGTSQKWVFKNLKWIENRTTDWLTHRQADEHKKVKIPYMWRRWGTPPNFLFGFIDEIEKQIITKKTAEGGQKKQNNFNIYNVAFFLQK